MNFTVYWDYVEPDEEAKVGAYPASNWANSVTFPEGEPKGSPVAEAGLEEGTLTFTGLSADTKYWAGARVGGYWRYQIFWTSAERLAPIISRFLEEHEAATKEVHGIGNTASFLVKPESPATFTQTYSTPTHTHAKAALGTNLPTNLNIVTTLLGTLVTEVNTSNTRTNQIAEALNELKQLVNGLIDDCQNAGIVK